MGNLGLDTAYRTSELGGYYASRQTAGELVFRRILVSFPPATLPSMAIAERVDA
jgi:hypothetical protein